MGEGPAYERALRSQMREVNAEEVETAAVKVGAGRFRARAVAPEVSHRLLRDAAERAVKRAASFVPFRLPPRYQVDLTFNSLEAIESKLRGNPRAQRVATHTLRFGSNDISSLLFEAVEGL